MARGRFRRRRKAERACLPAAESPSLHLRKWREGDFAAAGRLIALAYQGHLDSVINDQYRTTSGSLRFLHNIVRFPGCGQFDPSTSMVLARRDSEDLAGIVLCSRVNIDTGHVTQLCIDPRLRHAGLGRLLLTQCMQALSGQGAAAIVASTVALAHGVGLTVVAEGVETPEQLRFLRALGCDQYQGYHFSPPLPPQEFARLVCDWQKAEDGASAEEVTRTHSKLALP